MSFVGTDLILSQYVKWLKIVNLVPNVQFMSLLGPRVLCRRQSINCPRNIVDFFTI